MRLGTGLRDQPRTAAKSSPRSSKFRYWSNEAQPGASSTTSPGRAAAAAARTAAGTVPQSSSGTRPSSAPPDDGERPRPPAGPCARCRCASGARLRQSAPLSLPPRIRCTLPGGERGQRACRGVQVGGLGVVVEGHAAETAHLLEPVRQSLEAGEAAGDRLGAEPPRARRPAPRRARWPRCARRGREEETGRRDSDPGLPGHAAQAPASRPPRRTPRAHGLARRESGRRARARCGSKRAAPGSSALRTAASSGRCVSSRRALAAA